MAISTRNMLSCSSVQQADDSFPFRVVGAEVPDRPVNSGGNYTHTHTQVALTWSSSSGLVRRSVFTPGRKGDGGERERGTRNVTVDLDSDGAWCLLLHTSHRDW